MGGRRARASFRYQAFVPDQIAAFSPVVPFEVADLSADAETAIRALNEHASLSGLEAIGPLLLRSEAVASSRIEGYDVSSLNLARALIDPRAARGSARTVAANVSAMEEAIAIGDRTAPLTVDDLLAIHGVLMAGDERAQPGHLRQEQNWIGGRLGSPRDAAFVPPPESLVPSLLQDLIDFVVRDDLPGVPQAALAHAQFETIHPFIDGNGRVGRALVHVILRRRGVAPRFVPPISIVLAAQPSAYIAGLAAFREGQIGGWIGSFAEAARRAATASIELADRVAGLQGEWHERAGRPRSGSAASRLIALLPALPVLSAPTARVAIGVSQQQTLAALKTLAEAGVIRQLSAGRYDRQYAATELFDLLASYEKRIVGP
ncbi:MAG TPA: Fic family protein [Candidatus Limnocylindrales bacterium]|nr:Fic family protein [Candidatus Limnocylindrales bacterium]